MFTLQLKYFVIFQHICFDVLKLCKWIDILVTCFVQWNTPGDFKYEGTEFMAGFLEGLFLFVLKLKN